MFVNCRSNEEQEEEENLSHYSKKEIVYNGSNEQFADNLKQTDNEHEIGNNKIEQEQVSICSDTLSNKDKMEAPDLNLSCNNKCTDSTVDKIEETNLPQVSQSKKHRKRRNVEKSVKNIKTNRKFEVSIIKEEDLEKTLQRSNFLLNSNNPATTETSYGHKKRKSLGRRVSFADPYCDNEKTNRNNDVSGKYQQLNLESNNLNLVNEETDDIIKIDFTHSETETTVIESTDGEILSPKDIYKAFCKPKSILKKTSSDMNINYNYLNISTINENDELENSESFDESSFNDDEKRSAYNFVSIIDH